MPFESVFALFMTSTFRNWHYKSSFYPLLGHLLCIVTCVRTPHSPSKLPLVCDTSKLHTYLGKLPNGHNCILAISISAYTPKVWPDCLFGLLPILTNRKTKFTAIHFRTKQFWPNQKLFLFRCTDLLCLLSICPGFMCITDEWVNCCECFIVTKMERTISINRTVPYTREI